MSIKIHHGFPGSYKTSGAVMDDFIPAVLAGRHIITNVRGLDNEDNVRDVLEGQGMTIPDSFQLTHVDTTSSENMEMIRRFFHWCPNGAFLFLDEIQEIFPRSFRDSHVNALRFPGGLDAATEVGKPYTLELAFEKHRHFNWDMVVTTPHIAKVHPIVRGCAEGAYKHKNLAVLGSLFKGKYIEAFHPADTNGKKSDFYSIVRKSIKPYVFDLYQSTATGVATDTTSGQSIFKNPKVLGLLGLLGLLFVALSFAPTPKVFKGSSSPADKAPGSSVVGSPAVAPDQGVANTGNNAPVYGHNVGNSPVRAFHAGLAAKLSFLSWDGVITSYGFIASAPVWSIKYTSPDGLKRFDLTPNTANQLHLNVKFLNPCFASLSIPGSDLAYVQCSNVDKPPSAPPSDIALNSAVHGAKKVSPIK